MKSQRRKVETAMSAHSDFFSFSRKIHAESTAVRMVVKSPMVLDKFAATEEYETRRKPVQSARKTAMETPLENAERSPSPNVLAESPSFFNLTALRPRNAESAVRKIEPSARNRLQTGDASPVLTT